MIFCMMLLITCSVRLWDAAETVRLWISHHPSPVAPSAGSDPPDDTHGEEPNELNSTEGLYELKALGREDPYQVPFLEFLIVHRCAVWSGRVFNEQSKDKESHMLQC